MTGALGGAAARGLGRMLGVSLEQKAAGLVEGLAEKVLMKPAMQSAMKCVPQSANKEVVRFSVLSARLAVEQGAEMTAQEAAAVIKPFEPGLLQWGKSAEFLGQTVSAYSKALNTVVSSAREMAQKTGSSTAQVITQNVRHYAQMMRQNPQFAEAQRTQALASSHFKQGSKEMAKGYVKMKVNEAKFELQEGAREMLETQSRQMWSSMRDRSPLAKEIIKSDQSPAKPKEQPVKVPEEDDPVPEEEDFEDEAAAMLLNEAMLEDNMFVQGQLRDVMPRQSTVHLDPPAETAAPAPAAKPAEDDEVTSMLEKHVAEQRNKSWKETHLRDLQTPAANPVSSESAATQQVKPEVSSTSLEGRKVDDISIMMPANKVHEDLRMEPID